MRPSSPSPPSALTVASAAARPAAASTYTVTTQWQGGFGANVDVTNLGDPINGWTLALDASPPGRRSPRRGTPTVTQSGAAGHRPPTPATTRAIATGGTTSFGFNGSWTGGNPAPTAFALNGVDLHRRLDRPRAADHRADRRATHRRAAHLHRHPPPPGDARQVETSTAG